MALMQVTFLGTGTSQGVPVIACDCAVCQSDNPKDQRTRTSLWIQIDGKNLVIDTGPDFRAQILREKVKSLDAVLFTHEHKDHIAGLDDIRAFNFLAQSPMDLYLTQPVLNALKREFQYVFDGTNYPGIPQVETHLIADQPFELLGETIIPIQVMHYKMPVTAFRIRNFTYITDANYIDEENLKKIEGTEILVINALRRERHISHFNLEEAIALIQRINPGKAYLTHISHLLGFHEVVSRELPGNIEIAYDGLQFQI